MKRLMLGGKAAVKKLFGADVDFDSEKRNIGEWMFEPFYMMSH
jgi:hypothetical protein